MKFSTLYTIWFMKQLINLCFNKQTKPKSGLVIILLDISTNRFLFFVLLLSCLSKSNAGYFITHNFFCFLPHVWLHSKVNNSKSFSFLNSTDLCLCNTRADVKYEVKYWFKIRFSTFNIQKFHSYVKHPNL